MGSLVDCNDGDDDIAAVVVAVVVGRDGEGGTGEPVGNGRGGVEEEEGIDGE